MTVYTAEILEGMLAQRHCAPAWAFFPQVRNATGLQATVRTIDAIAMSLYPSRGLDVHGFEIKISRSDWLRELRQPEKTEEIARYCDFFWVVAPIEAIMRGELPPRWGQLVPGTGTLRVKQQAEKLEARPLDRLFIAALLRSYLETLNAGPGPTHHRAAGYREGPAGGRAIITPTQIQKRLRRLLTSTENIAATIKRELQPD